MNYGDGEEDRRKFLRPRRRDFKDPKLRKESQKVAQLGHLWVLEERMRRSVLGAIILSITVAIMALAIPLMIQNEQEEQRNRSFGYVCLALQEMAYGQAEFGERVIDLLGPSVQNADDDASRLRLRAVIDASTLFRDQQRQFARPNCNSRDELGESLERIAHFRRIYQATHGRSGVQVP